MFTRIKCSFFVEEVFYRDHSIIESGLQNLSYRLIGLNQTYRMSPVAQGQ